jgi:hypothetical protein
MLQACNSAVCFCGGGGALGEFETTEAGKDGRAAVTLAAGILRTDWSGRNISSWISLDGLERP